MTAAFVFTLVVALGSLLAASSIALTSPVVPTAPPEQTARSFATGIEDIVAPSIPTASSSTLVQCENWLEPVLCRVEFRGAREDGEWSQIDPNRTIELPPEGRLRLEVRGWDQEGRPFPTRRMGFGHDAEDCSGLLEFAELDQDEFEVSAGSDRGRCSVQLWVPGNLNLEWRLDFEIRRPVRTEYGRAEAEILADRLFRALLGRDPKPSGRRHAASEIEAGNLEAQVREIVGSPEFREKSRGVDASAMLERIYRGLFDRDPGSAAVRAYLSSIQRGEYADVVLNIVRSPEFEEFLARETG